MSASKPPPGGSSWSHGRPEPRALASGESPNHSGRVVGRAVELARITALIEAARTGVAAALVIEGEPGIGKTTLLGAASAMAKEFTCLATRGVESEAALGHAALLELVTPLRDQLGDLPAAQSEALASALGWGPAGATGDRFLVGAATLSVLAGAAERAPVLVLVDDLQWMDPESAAALLFAARRLRHDGVAFVFAMRSEVPLPVQVDGLDVLTLLGLPPSEAAGLLPGRLAERVAAELVKATRGNPLAFAEVVERLTDAQRLGAAPLPEPLPLGARLEQLYHPLLAGLSAPAWKAVLLCAANPRGGSAASVAALRLAGVDADAALEEAEERGVLVRDRGVLQFRHPLARTTAWLLATPAQRRAAHRALAAVLPGDAAAAARTWHLSEAATGPDDAVADALVAVAGEERERRGYAAASAALERAAELSTHPERAAERLADAVADAFVAGDVARTRALSARLLDSPSRPRDRARVLATLGVLEQYAGSVPRAGELLSAAAELAEGPDRVWALAELGITRFRLNDLAGLYACAEEIVAVADRDDLRQRVPADFLHGVALVLGGDAAGAVGPLTSVIELAPSVKLRDDPRHLLYLGLAAGFLGDVRPAIAAGEPLLAAARERGALGFLVPALALTAAARAWTGDHRGAFADAGEAADLGEQLGYAADVAVAVEMLAWQSAARGLHDDARQAMAQARALTDRAGTTGVASHQAITAAFCALCRLDLSEAATVLEARIAVDGGVGEMGQPLGVAPTLVEAYVGLGRAVEAADLAARYAAASAAAVDPPTTALVARCLALTASDDELAVDRFETALAAHAQAPDVFEAARTRLLYGSWLRRAGRRTLARNQLGAAQAAFAAMDLTAWELRTADELAATGATARPRTTLASEPLTAQETRVSQLVARGLSNREVAAAMFVSPKTVEHHLGSVFRKRGFRSRAALASALATTPEND